MTSNTHVQRTLSAFAIAGTMGMAAWAGTALAHAEPVPTINLTDVPYIDALPACAEEDCSDQPHQIGVWYNQGNYYLELGEPGQTFLVVDDTVRR